MHDVVRTVAHRNVGSETCPYNSITLTDGLKSPYTVIFGPFAVQGVHRRFLARTFRIHEPTTRWMPPIVGRPVSSPVCPFLVWLLFSYCLHALENRRAWPTNAGRSAEDSRGSGLLFGSAGPNPGARWAPIRSGGPRDGLIARTSRNLRGFSVSV